MPTAQEWYNVFAAQTAATVALNTTVAAARTDIGKIGAAVDNLFLAIKPPSIASGASVIAELDFMARTVRELADAVVDAPAGGGGSVSVDLGPLVAQLTGLDTTLDRRFRAVSLDLANLALVLSDESPTGGLFVVKEAIQQQTAALTQIAAVIASTAGGGGAVDLSPLADALGAAFGSGGRTLGDLIGDLLSPASAEAAEPDTAGLTELGAFFAESRAAAKAQRAAYGEHSFASITDGAKAILAKIIAGGADAAQTVMTPLGVLFEGITTAGVDQIIGGLAADASDPNKSVQDRAMSALTRAYKLGQQAHFLAAAVEAFHPLHEFGLSNAAAAITDLAGFQPISQAVFRPHHEATITRPMRWQTNARFRPEIANVNALNDFVRRRTMSEGELRDALPLHGFDDETCDRYVETVWRDPTIRDLALSLEDTNTNLDWLRDRVKTAGYEDADADRLTDALIQRSERGNRDRVRAAAVAAYADGTIARYELEATLDTLGLTTNGLARELVTADIQRRRDLVRDGLATYRRQYVNDVIDEDDYRLAIVVLGVDPDRVELIIADANATKAPKIAAEEARPIKEAIRQIQTQLVPKIRRLFELGQVSAETYRQTLIDAGIGEQVAAQAVALDTARVLAVSNQHAAGDVQAAVDAVLQERRDVLTARFRGGQLTEAAYRQGLLDSGLASDLVDVIVTRETVRRGTRTTEQQRDLYTEQYRKGVLTEETYRARLTATGLSFDEVLVLVARENTRKLPTPAPGAPVLPTTPLR